MRGWDGIQEAVALEDAGSFAAAAKLLGMSTSHVSRAIAQLEANLQTEIFRRTTRRLTVTDDGLMLLAQFRRLVRERDEAFASVSPDREPEGEIRISCSTYLGERFVEPIVRAFARRYPKLDINLDLTNRVVDLVGEGFDIGIRTGELQDSRLIGSRIASRGLHVCASPDYLATRGTPIAIEDLRHHECLIGTSPAWHFKVNKRRVDLKPSGRWRCTSGRALVAAAREGMGICQVPDFYAGRHMQEGSLISLLEAFRLDDEPIWAVYPAQKHIQPKVRALTEHLRMSLPQALGAKA
jgi:DNA-binding transcriptional LysR family regulator